ncbi:chemotaxis protein CheW [Candidatus Riflebacteria bacterium]
MGALRGEGMQFEDKELIEEFVIESKEHLATIEDDFLTLEKQKENPDLELVNSIFRPIHSIKGASGFLGLERIGELSHNMETLLSRIREGEIKPGNELIDALLKGVDSLNNMLDDIENSNETEIKSLVELLESHLNGENSASGKGEKKESSSNYLDDTFEGFRVDPQIREKYSYFYVLDFDLFEAEKKGKKTIRQFIKESVDFGEILDCNLSLNKDLLVEEKRKSKKAVLLKILFASILEPELLPDALSLNPESISFIPLPEPKKEDEPVKSSIEDNKVVPLHPPKNQEAEEDNREKSNSNGGCSKSSESIRIHVGLLDKLMNQASELVLVRNQNMLFADKDDSNSMTIAKRLDGITTDIQRTIMQTRMQPIGNVFNKFPRVVRDLGKKLNKNIAIEITGSEVDLDKTIIEAITDPLTHLIRNCCDHGIEEPAEREKKGKAKQGLIHLSAYHQEGQINIKLEDDGKGISLETLKEKALDKEIKTQAELSAMDDNELLNLILLPGFSTNTKVSDVSGRGVGMDVVNSFIENLGGNLELESKEGRGTNVHMRLPLTLAIIPSLIVRVGEERFAIPEANLEELVCLYDQDVASKIEIVSGREVFRLREQFIPMLRLSEVLKSPKPLCDETWTKISNHYREEQEEKWQSYQDAKKKDPDLKFRQSLNFAVIRVGTKRFGLIVDTVIGSEEIVVKPMHVLTKASSCFSGATIMGDGRVILILDLQGMAKFSGINMDKSRDELKEKSTEKLVQDTQSVILFESGENEQFAVPLELIRYIKKITSEEIEQIGEKEFINIDGVSNMVLRLDKNLEVSPLREQKEYFFLLPKHIKRPFGIIVSKILDVEECTTELNTDSFNDVALFGSSIVRDRITLFLDLFSLIEKAQPGWFAEGQQELLLPGRDKKILLVEDNKFFRKLVTGYFQAEGFEVSLAKNGLEGLKKMKEEKVDLVVSDIDMPIMDGWNFIKKVKGTQQWRNIPAIALTASNLKSNRNRASESGFDHYFLKDQKAQLLNTVKEIFADNQKDEEKVEEVKYRECAR